MNITAWFLMISILLNTAFLLGAPIWLFVRYLIRRTKWWIVGQGSNGIEIREGRPKNGYYLWKVGKKIGLVLVQGNLLGQATDGRPVLWVDTDSMTQITPERRAALKLLELPDALKDAVYELGALPGYKGVALNDNEKTTVTDDNGKPKVLTYHVWTRINGWRLFKAFTDIRVAQLNETNAGMWATIERLTPLLSIVTIIMLLVVMVMMSRLG